MRKYIPTESVDLCYIDPPFNSKRNYNQIYNNLGGEDRAQAQAFVDTWVWDEQADLGFTEILSNDVGRFNSQTIDLIKGIAPVLKKGSLLAYLVSMAIRITEVKRVLKQSGTFYLHCDPTASHYLKILLDAVFVSGGGDYKNEVIWKRTHSHGGAKRFGPVHDIIFYYTKSSSFTWNPQYTAYSENYEESFFKHYDPDGRRYRLTILTGSGTRNGSSGKPWQGYDPTNSGRHWAIPGYVRDLIGQTDNVQTALDRLAEIGRVIWPKDGNVPSFKQYIDDMEGVSLQDVFTDIPPISAAAAERLGYPTQKPEALLERLISASSNEGDTVLDVYCGCGTTVAVAQRLNRNWIGVDITYQSISLVLRRLEDQYGKAVVDNVVLDGVPRDMDSASALALKRDDRVRKEFEKWAVLTYTNNRAIINDKKGGDGGIDGIAYFMTAKADNAKIVFQVKSGNVGRGDISKFNNDRVREGAELGFFITLNAPTAGMKSEANAAGTYDHEIMGRTYPRIQIVTIEELLANKRLDIAMSREVLKKAKSGTNSGQTSMELAAEFTE
ncbi:MAG: DNA methyltransferase [Chthonomonadales bacterium]